MQGGFDDEGLVTVTSEEQCKIEAKVCEMYKQWMQKPGSEFQFSLVRDAHVEYVLDGLEGLPAGFKALDASRPWLVFWMVHSLELMGKRLPASLQKRAVSFLSHCQHPTGGFGGGPQQEPHLAPTYAAVAALCSIGTQEAYDCINRRTMKDFLLRMKSFDGAFHVSRDGEMDTRGAYTALSIASMLNLLCKPLVAHVGDWLVKCQTYEGGFGGEPGNEAHGGYTFCGLAALMILGETHKADIPKLLHWTAQRQMSVEGGFQGRTNKLVDGCYSFWVGSLFPLLDMCMMATESAEEKIDTHHRLWEHEALQKYVLWCCQQRSGGLKDKPGKFADYYHTCYCLSGLSLAQRSNLQGHYKRTIPSFPKETEGKQEEKPHARFEHPNNLLKVTNPIYNVECSKLAKALAYFQTKPTHFDEENEA